MISVPDRLTQNIRQTIPDARIKETSIPLCPGISLYLLNGDNMQRRFSVDEIQMIQKDVPYWSLCWASGQALARYLLNNKYICSGKKVFDFGAGSGIGAIAAALSGARAVTALDIDESALEAVLANASLNQVHIDTCRSMDEIQEYPDVIIAADVLYDRENLSFAEMFLSRPCDTIFADSRVKSIDLHGYEKIAEITATTIPDLNEADEFNKVSIYKANVA